MGKLELTNAIYVNVKLCRLRKLSISSNYTVVMTVQRVKIGVINEYFIMFLIYMRLDAHYHFIQQCV